MKTRHPYSPTVLNHRLDLFLAVLRWFPLPFLGLVLILSACQPTGGPSSDLGVAATVSGPTLVPTESDPGVIAARSTPDLSQLLLLAAYRQEVEESLQQPVPVLPLEDDLNENQQQAQSIALADPQFLQYTHDQETGAPLRSEVFGIYPLRDSDITEYAEACRQHGCYRVEMYNFALNLYLAAIVDLDTQSVVDRIGVENAQPDIPPHLTRIAVEIARHAPEVLDALGYTPLTSEALMANTKTSLNDSRCERSQHLCVAPTFVAGNSALWAIVDLTEGTLVGVRWTTVGSTGEAVTEKNLQNESMMRLYCQHTTPLERDGWRMDYILTGSDGLRISDVTYQYKPILKSAKLVDWHVSYSSLQGFGYSDAVGCPVFSQAAVVAVQPPSVEDIMADGEVVGFALVQDFWSDQWPRPCNYYYRQRFEFYQDGRFRPMAVSLGRGCGDDGTYRPVTRIALAGDYTLSEWDGNAWTDWTNERWQLADEIPMDSEGHSLRLSREDGSGFYVIPSTGQFGDGGRGDHPYVYATLDHPDQDEGESDMPTIGPCCNEDYQQGPERFIDADPEPILNSPLVFWYVPQIKNDGTPGSEYCWAESLLEDGVYVPKAYPCSSGPFFTPLS